MQTHTLHPQRSLREVKIHHAGNAEYTEEKREGKAFQSPYLRALCVMKKEISRRERKKIKKI